MSDWRKKDETERGESFHEHADGRTEAGKARDEQADGETGAGKARDEQADGETGAGKVRHEHTDSETGARKARDGHADGETGVSEVLYEPAVSMEQGGEELDSSYRELLGVLNRDRDQVERAVNLEGNPELSGKLDFVLADGMEMGHRRHARQRAKRMSLQASATLLAMLFVLTAFVRISPTFAAIVKEIPGFGGFVELVSYDRSLQSALDNEYIQLVGRSDERNGYSFTVNGVLADAQRVVLLYTAEGPGINEEDTTFLPYELKDESGGDIIAGIGSSHYFRKTDDKDGGVQDYLDIMMSPGVPVPQEIQFKLQVGDEWLEVQVPIDHSRFAEMMEEIPLNKTIEVEGQRIEMTKAVITPLQVSITFKGDPENTKRLNDFIDLELVDERGRSYRTNSGMGDLDTEIVRHFQSSYFQKPKSLTLKAKGLLMSDRGMKIVIDTEKETLLQRPDGNLKLIGLEKSAQAIDLKFELSQEEGIPGTKRIGPLFKYEGVATDAGEQTYPLNYGDSRGVNFTELHSGEQDRAIYYYHIPNADYEQPLTLEVDQYLGHAFKDISIPIK